MQKQSRNCSSAQATAARLRALVMLALALGPVSLGSADGARAQERIVEEAPSGSDRERPAAKFLRTENALPNRYIVVLEDEPVRDESSLVAGEEKEENKDEVAARNAARVEALATRLASAHEAQIGHLYSHSIRGFSAYMTEDQAKALSERPEVAYVEEETQVSIQTTQVGALPGLDRIDQRNRPLDTNYTYSATGMGVHVYVIDSGILSSHQEFGGRATADADFAWPPLSGLDCYGHGTFVAAKIAGRLWGVAKDARIHGVRVLGCNEFAPVSQLIAGVDWVTFNHVKPAVANISLSGPASLTLDDSVRRLIAAGVTCVISAGNGVDTDGDPNTPSIPVSAGIRSPGRVAEAITVSGVGAADVRLHYANFGPAVDVFAPGERVVSAGNRDNTAGALMSGTSAATPHVTGVVAQLLQHRPGPPAVVHETITSRATAGVVVDARPGTPNRLLFSQQGGAYFADVTGDGKADAIAVTDQAILVKRAGGSRRSFRTETWLTFHHLGEHGTAFADVTGDGRADAIFVAEDGLLVRRSDGEEFLALESWTLGPYYGTRGTFFADVNDDRMADAIVVNDDMVTVRRSTGAGFLPNESWTTDPYFGSRGTFFADVDDDGMADAIVVNDDGVVVRRSDGTSFLPNERWTSGPYFGSRGTFFADVTGDGAADAIVVNEDGIVVRRSYGSGFMPDEAWTTGPYFGQRGTAFADTTGEGTADAIVVNDGGVVVRRSTGSNFLSNFTWASRAYFGTW